MKKRIFLEIKAGIIALMIILMTLSLLSTNVIANGNTIMNYGDLTLNGGFQAGHYNEWWDLTQGDLTLTFTYDANGLIDDYGGGAHAWGEIGLRSPCYGDFNPTWMTEGSGVWLATDYDWTINTFDPDPIGSPSQDMDDKLVLQKGGGMGEGSYNLPMTPPNPWANHAVWFDRDGVDIWQASMWGAIDGVTYNTGGIYYIEITLNANSPTDGTAYMTINGESQGFYDPGWHSGPADLMPSGMTFTGDLAHLQVFYGIYGYGATHTVEFQDITVDGYLGDPPYAPCYQQNIDIKPGSYPNSINTKSKGNIPVAILTNYDFDASTVNPDTVVFLDASPTHWAMDDVDDDGDLDMIFHFKTQECDFSLLLDEGEEYKYAYLTGETIYGDYFWGKDTVRLVGPLTQIIEKIVQQFPILKQLFMIIL